MTDATDQTFEQDVIERSRERAGGRRLLGRVVRAVPAARPGAGAGGRGDRRRGRAGQGRRRREPARRRPLPRAGHPGREGVQGRAARGRVHRRGGPRAAVDSFLRGLLPSEADELAALGDEASLRRALELQPNHPAALGALARLENASDPVLAPALAALDQGETERGLSCCWTRSSRRGRRRCATASAR